MKEVGKQQAAETKPDVNKNMARFLETWAPLRKFREPIHDEASNRARPSIHMYCPRCNSEQTFIIRNEQHSNIKWFYETLEEPFKTVEIWRYICMGCRTFGRLFFLERGEDKKGSHIRKLGQRPDWEAPIDPELKKLLGDQATTFRRGLDCEATGYGIGAFAYYRRVVEDTIGGLLERIPLLLSQPERPRYAEALADVKAAKDAQTKIELVKDLLPSRLRPDGINPLEILHSELSVGLHGKSDEDCLDDAEALRSALAYLTVELGRAQEAGQTFTAGMRKFLEKRGAKSPQQ